MKTYTTGFNDDELLTGNEIYPVIGDLLDVSMAEALYSAYGSLRFKRYWDCVEKTMLAKKLLSAFMTSRKAPTIMVGALEVWSIDKKSSYGFDFEPPFQFHAWLQIGELIIDIALPGVIEKGLQLRDHIGPSLVGREPVIFAGDPKTIDWLSYEPYKTLKG